MAGFGWHAQCSEAEEGYLSDHDCLFAPGMQNKGFAHNILSLTLTFLGRRCEHSAMGAFTKTSPPSLSLSLASHAPPPLLSLLSRLAFLFPPYDSLPRPGPGPSPQSLP